jgi:structural maintenance of chromosome 1
VFLSYVHVLYHSKASSSVLAVDERQSLETLTREEKTASRTLAQLSEKEQGFEEKKTTRTEELHQRNAKREEVPISCLQLKYDIKNDAFLYSWNKELHPYKRI